MANEQNLTQKGKRLSTEEAQRLAKASVEARRRKKEIVKTAREFAVAVLNSEVIDKETGETYVLKYAMIQKLIAKAISEVDLNSIKYILELIKESPADMNEKTEDIPTDIKKGVDIDSWIKRQVEGND